MAGPDELAELRPAPKRRFGETTGSQGQKKGKRGAEWRSSGSPSSKDPGTCRHPRLSLEESGPECEV